MLAKALEYENFDKFDRVRFPKIRYAGMLQYDGELKLPSRYLLSPPEIERTSGEYLVHNGFFNPEMEEYVEIPSDSGITFNVKPKMNALEIAEKARDAVLRAKFHQLHVNLPNSDMVGHTVGVMYVVVTDHGNAEDMVKRDKKGYPLLDKNGNIQILTSHTLQPVPTAIGGAGLAPGIRFCNDLPNAGLANVAATLMNLHRFEAPSAYEPALIEVINN
ncbi:hypothetical protein Cgig2_013547 [Carnegiea gigantea]|uniref:Metalloenzyme domain-containing protein n=1 Tax=Carnegiea gigantea TaxID=171969 RepID=A0A9Q1JUS9_9CARY|nr:hypothetical protein Cgig2_013547 [Carnegiea gigantea]